ncbi:MAG TPA: DUF1549 domain-containing protein, partial [Gemmataceae bacterium]|nr:DUF1549 domain-containing protein [Gemmataceae bacterium]
ASLDIIGRIATPQEVEQFLKDPPATRRAQLIERLLAHEDYARNWANLWTNWALTRSGPFSRGTYQEKMTVWFEDQFSLNTPYDKMVVKLLTATGNTEDNGATNFLVAHVGLPNPPNKRKTEGQFDMVPITSRISRLFLGIQTQCTQCHDHPFDNSLKQEHFWGLNAYLRQVKSEGMRPTTDNRRGMGGKLTLTDDETVNVEAGVYYEKRNGVFKYTQARFLDGTKIPEGDRPAPDGKGNLPIQGAGRRFELAQRVVNHENFPKAYVNRMWAHFFGRGFCQPFDDFNSQNQISMPELLDELAAAFKHYGYDQKQLIRWVCNSKAYHLSCVANKTNDKAEAEPYFSRMMLRPLTPEQLFESLMLATKAEAAETRDGKTQVRNRWLGSLIANFGDDEGNEITFNGTVVQALMMMNGKEINDAIQRKDKGTLAMISRSRGGYGDPNRRFYNRAIINDLYLTVLNRRPTDDEVSKILRAFPLYRNVRDKDPAAPYHDLFWALLNSNEFMLNH